MVKPLAVFLAATIGGVAVGVLRTLLKPRPEEWERPATVLQGRHASVIIIDDLYDGLPPTREELDAMHAWWLETPWRDGLPPPSVSPGVGN